MARLYAIVVGAGLVVVGIIGFTVASLHYSPSHNWLHVISGIFGLGLGFLNGGKNAKLFAQVFGALYILVALAGFLHAPMSVESSLHLNLQSNVIHMAFGLISLWVGFAARAKPTTANV